MPGGTWRRGMVRRGRLRIIGGEWKRRQLSLAELPGLRPTPDAVRETLFNWLQGRLTGRSCLDLFAGSGALGFEAASRGAARVVMIERNRRAAAGLMANKQRLAADKVDIIVDDALRYLRRTNEQFDIVFVDPPFEKGLVRPACDLLHRRDVLKAGALVYVEAERRLSPLPVPASWELVHRNVASTIGYHLLRKPCERASSASTHMPQPS